MQVKKIIDKCCSPTLEKYGFRYLGATSPGFWEFERYEGDIKQEITFQKYSYSKRITISMEAGNIRHISLSYFITGDETQQWWDYETEEDLKEICEEHMKAFEEKNGMQVILDMSVLELDSTIEMKKEILNNPSERAEKFSKEYNLNFEWDVANIKKLEEILLEKREKTNVAIDEEFLLSAAAYYGEIVIRNYGGEWICEKTTEDEDSLFAYIHKIANDVSDEIESAPLSNVVTFYSSPFFFRHKMVPKFENLDSWIKEEMEKKNNS